MMKTHHKKYFILFPILIVILLPLVIMLLWNNIVSDIFIIKKISYLEAIGLFILSRILFGSFGYRNKPQAPFVKDSLKEKWINMTDDEKEQLKEEWKKRSTGCI